MKAAFLYKPVEASVPLVAIVRSDRSTRVPVTDRCVALLEERVIGEIVGA